MMKNLLSLVLVIIGAFLGIYLGLWVLFIGGILDIVNFVRATDDLDGMLLLWGIIKMTVASFVGWFTFLLFAFIAKVLN